MMENRLDEEKLEKAVLVGLSCHSFGPEDNSDERTMAELSALLETAGGECVGMTLQSRPAPDARTFIGEGKVEEVKMLAEAGEADLIVFDNDLSPSQLKNLEEMIGRTVLDRSALILDIFAQRARTGEGKLQVELAQYQYILPRLAGMWTHLVRQTAGGGKSPIGTRGPGETQLETDRRHIRRRIDKLRGELEQVRQVRAVQRRQRKKTEMPLVAIVGYTNAGKSTLLNLLTDAGIEANDRLFDTLDPTTRKKRISETQEILLSDTVGFIRKLPHHLISAFKATLEELSYADLLLHVVDVSDPDWELHAQTVDKVIAQLGAQEIPRVMVYNKIDRCENLPYLSQDSVLLSAKTGQGETELLAAIEKALGRGKHQMHLLIPYSDGAALDMLHREAQVLSVEYAGEGTVVEAIMDDKTCGRMQKYAVEEA
ncbi:MAG: GTPase HflX [Butyricicoccus pullicaecorum]|nr:GTPase HflX [Butyricicoccus pullicaecorum]